MKYDVLTALGAFGCAGDKHRQRIALRLMTLLTARYNWQEDSLTTGQREIAALWSVDQRTVKREMARLRELGWLILKRPAARGRVACYGLGLDALLGQTEPCWANVGPDFVVRMSSKPVDESNPTVVPFPVMGEGAWARIATTLQAEDAGVFNAWFAPLVTLGERDGVLRLKVPSRFHGSFVRTHHLSRLQALARHQGLDVDLVD
ncbi:DnaA N-terminal domain-containing protein [Jannaschia faecimaris]|uniref:DnaA N-terminal domain-containing protein n=1 Tax=Jannaschia faecimaris TaxID=1244108 RepID=UPI001FCCD069|nr:DnaA N-terminal domain-containing protein [Jannaschia faecimaris]